MHKATITWQRKKIPSLERRGTTRWVQVRRSQPWTVACLGRVLKPEKHGMQVRGFLPGRSSCSILIFSSRETRIQQTGSRFGRWDWRDLKRLDVLGHCPWPPLALGSSRVTWESHRRSLVALYWAVLCWVVQSCPTLCDPTDCNPPGSSVCGILWARTLEWVASSSEVQSFSEQEGGRTAQAVC